MPEETTVGGMIEIVTVAYDTRLASSVARTVTVCAPYARLDAASTESCRSANGSVDPSGVPPHAVSASRLGLLFASAVWAVSAISSGQMYCGPQNRQGSGRPCQFTNVAPTAGVVMLRDGAV